MELSHHLTTLFDELMQPSALFSHTAKTMFPITEELRGNDLYISAELPGMKIEDVNVELTDGYLFIRGIKKDEYHTDDGKYRRNERRFGEFVRTLYIGDVEREKIKAKIVNGVLEITVSDIIKTPKTNKIAIEY